jgi:putative ABC transport system substrate-binding protein
LVNLRLVAAGRQELPVRPHSNSFRFALRKNSPAGRDGGDGVNRPPSTLTMLLSRHTRRREFIALIGGAAATWPVAARAQQMRNVPLVGVLIPFEKGDEEGERRQNAFENGLREFGWTNGQNVHIEYRWVGSNPDRIRDSAIELVGMKPDVILTSSALTLAPLQRQTSTIPIVFTNIADPVSSGFVATLAHPGGNITAFSPAEFSMYGKLLELLKEAVPKLTRVAVIMNPEQAPQAGMMHAIEAAAPTLSVKTSNFSVRDPLERSFASFAQQPNGGLIVLPNPVVDENRELIARTAVQYGLPTIYTFRYYVSSGGLMSYGIDTVDHLRKGASYVDRILRGARPADLPVEQPTKFELVINLKTAKALGLTIPDSFLHRADEVIE